MNQIFSQHELEQTHKMSELNGASQTSADHMLLVVFSRAIMSTQYSKNCCLLLCELLRSVLPGVLINTVPMEFVLSITRKSVGKLG